MWEIEPVAAFIAGAFVLAGLVKGTVGLGLPTVAIGLLAVVMPPAEAAAILILPSLATNIWQMAAGPHLRSLVRRLWPAIMGVAIGTLAGTGWLAGADPRYARALLGLALVIYAASGLWSLRLTVTAAAERWAGPVVGTLTGLVTAATGIFAIPAVPYLQAIGLEKEELIQALGLSFTVSTAALAVNLALSSTFTWSLGPSVAIALVAAFAGMGLGQALRTRLEPATFRVLFFVAIAILGAYLIVRATV
ncbi:MAG: sulfite exporter TauE/SafE family protein [Alphaproteobacteria bacterium]|nr:sulfite exporter TauE/SafE family protein [Alphaproteobacteria bacterium]